MTRTVRAKSKHGRRYLTSDESPKPNVKPQIYIVRRPFSNVFCDIVIYSMRNKVLKKVRCGPELKRSFGFHDTQFKCSLLVVNQN